MKGIQKTNAARLLDRAGIAYTLIPYAVDVEHLDAGHIADTLGEDINRVFKTIVLRGERKGLFVCVVPGNADIDLKKAARAVADKKAELIAMRELLPLTGYIRGGCSPVGMKRPLPTFFHSTALDFDEIYVSAGQRGLQLRISPAALMDYVGATVTDLVNDSETKEAE